MGKLPGPRTPVGHIRWGARLMRDLHTGLWDLYEEFGPVVQLGYRPMRFVYLFGPEANELILAGRPDAFRWRDAFEPLEVVTGSTAVVLSDGEEHRRRRRLVQPAFHKRRIDAQVRLIVEEVDRTIDGWSVGDRLELYAELRATVRRIVIRALFGDQLSARAEELGDHLARPLEYVQRQPPRFDVNLPGSEYRRVLADMARADQLVFGEIATRRANGSANETDAVDVLDMLLATRDEDGGGLSDQEVRDQTMSLIAAGYDTTSAGAAWAVYDVARHPEVWKRLAEEIEEVVGDAPLDAGHLREMHYLDHVVNEVLRIHTPAVVAGRRVVEDVELHGHRIPAGRMVIYSAHVTHRMPELWPEPDAFRPERWENEPAPYSYIPFGGGYRRCLGFALALVEIKVVLVQLVRRTQLDLERTDIRPTGLSSSHPDGGVPATVVSVATT
jgi:cytochrome P450